MNIEQEAAPATVKPQGFSFLINFTKKKKKNKQKTHKPSATSFLATMINKLQPM